MNNAEHLTDDQLTDYLGNSVLRPEAKHRLGRHLLLCDFCLKRLPAPTAEQLWAALMTDEIENDLAVEETTLARFFKSGAELLKQPKILVLSASTMTVVLFFSAFIWLNAGKSSSTESEVAENYERPSQPVFNRNSDDEQMNLPAMPPSGKEINRSMASSPRAIPERNSSPSSNVSSRTNLKVATRNNPNSKVEAKSSDEKDARISTTRGGGESTKCGNQPLLELTTGFANESVLLKWKKLPKAAKYHLYVSDDEEILIEEYETERETLYVLEKPLDPRKTYRWKIMVTTADGKTIAGEARKFNLKSLRRNRNKRNDFGQKKRTVRCSQNN